MRPLSGPKAKVIFKKSLGKDDEWIVVIDELNEQLHEDSVKITNKKACYS